jgi:hypothetical protein
MAVFSYLRFGRTNSNFVNENNTREQKSGVRQPILHYALVESGAIAPLPEHGHPVGLHEQSQAQLRRQEIGCGDCHREPDITHPPPNRIVRARPLLLASF